MEGAIHATLGSEKNDAISQTPKFEKSILRGTTSKSLEERALIRKAVEQTPLFSCLDVDQIESFVENATLVEYDRGENIIVEGDWGENFYILAGGSCDILEKLDGIEKQFDVKHSGTTFGVGGFLFNRKRSATVRARTKVFCWVMSRDRFWKHCLQSERLSKVFQENASITLPNGEQAMTGLDFVKACFSGQIPESSIKVNQILSFYNTVMGQRYNAISFKEFVLFQVLMARPDPEYDIAFLLMDTDKKGYVTLKDLKNYIDNFWLSKESQAVFQFNMDCDLVKRFFGRDGRRRLRVEQLSVFLSMLKKEVAQQAFETFDPQRTGYIDAKSLLKLVRIYCEADLPPILEQRIRSVYEQGGERFFNFADFMAFESMLSLLPAYSTAIKLAVEWKGTPVSKDDLKVVAKDVLGVKMSKLESNILFNLFDEKRLNQLDLDSMHRGVGQHVGKDLVPVRGRHGLFTFAPPPGYYLGNQMSEPSSNLDGEKEEKVLTILDKVIPMFTGLALGGLAGAAGIATVFPFDLIKTRLQNDAGSLYRGSFDCFKQVVTQDGVFGLYRGLIPAVVGMTPEKAVKLYVNDMLRLTFAHKERIGHISFPMEILAGIGAGASQTIFSTPVEAVKIQLQIHGERVKMLQGSGKPLPSIPSISGLVKHLGIFGLYRGASACLLRDMSFSGIYFPTYAYLKRSLSSNQEPKPIHLLVAGALAGVPAAFFTCPADVIKTRMQVPTQSGEVGSSSIREVVAATIKNEGVEGFFKGAGMRVLRQSPQFAVTLLAYELLHKAFASTISPDLLPGPPTNAPVKQEDYMAAFYRGNMSKRIEQIQRMLDATSS